ncbi:short chain fatty acid transporter [Haemophilus influenzae]|uniref:Short chain fatty acid transporter n=1 Tax=Haemophilus influenzae TaxID=727 RepID=A0A2X1PPY4_HAEIF|nr:short chain fatty acid transporter [Haemophilus influenzae]
MAFGILLGFGMQMALIVVTGNALATSPQIRKFLSTIASIAKTPAQGVVLVTFMGSIACIINWGFGFGRWCDVCKRSRAENKRQ